MLPPLIVTEPPAPHPVGLAGMRAGQLEDHAADCLSVGQNQGRRGAGERDVDLAGQPGIELTGLVVDREARAEPFAP
jgi:hypothetical protein